jgi:multimeric flavodoxin WrbA
MQGEEVLEKKEINTDEGTYVLVFSRRDLTSHYPGMILYTLRLVFGDRLLALFRTNTYEYSPTSPLEAEAVVWKKAEEWERSLHESPLEFFAEHLEEVREPVQKGGPDVLILQGSPRADGNSGIMASWARESAESAGLACDVIFIHDLSIHACIGCYQCYNTGFCTFEDEMRGIIASLRRASLLVVCTPVYTSTVPAGLKLVIDRCQAYHAEMILGGRASAKKGLLFSVAGRTGKDNFTCVTRVINDFMRNLHIAPSGEVLLDGIDRLQDIRSIPGTEQNIKEMVRSAISR